MKLLLSALCLLTLTQTQAVIMECARGEHKAENLIIKKNDDCLRGYHGFSVVLDDESEYCLATDQFIELNIPLQACYDFKGSSRYGTSVEITWALDNRYE